MLLNLRRYLEDEHRRKHKAAWDDAGWGDDHTWRPKVHGTPEQTNGWDCGVFMCKTADYLSQGAKLDFSQVRPGALSRHDPPPRRQPHTPPYAARTDADALARRLTCPTSAAASSSRFTTRPCSNNRTRVGAAGVALLDSGWRGCGWVWVWRVEGGRMWFGVGDFGWAARMQVWLGGGVACGPSGRAASGTDSAAPRKSMCV